MKVDFDDGRIFDFCDICGAEVDSDFEITIDYGSEDPCWGCSSDENELLTTYDEKYDALYSYLIQPTYKYCNECRCGENAMKAFEDLARSNRVSVINKLIEEKTLPEFSDKELAKEERLEELSLKVDKLVDKFKQKSLSDFGIVQTAKELAAAVNEQERLLHSL